MMSSSITFTQASILPGRILYWRSSKKAIVFSPRLSTDDIPRRGQLSAHLENSLTVVFGIRQQFRFSGGCYCFAKTEIGCGRCAEIRIFARNTKHLKSSAFLGAEYTIRTKSLGAASRPLKYRQPDTPPPVGRSAAAPSACSRVPPA